MDEKLMEIDSSLTFGNEVLDRENLPEILNVEEILDQRFQELSSEFLVNLNYSCVKYIPNEASSLNDEPGKLIVTKSDPMLSKAYGKGLTESTEGEDCCFAIETKDSQGQRSYSGFDQLDVDIRCVEKTNIITSKIIDSKNGFYEVKYKPEVTGKYQVSITVNSDAIRDSPFQLEVKERVRQSKVAAEVTGYWENDAKVQQDFSCGLNELAIEESNFAGFNNFEVNPQYMKLLKRVFNDKLQEIEKQFCVRIICDENKSQVSIRPSKTTTRQNRFLEGCDGFINLYQTFILNIGREEVELPKGSDATFIHKVVSNSQALHPMIIEKTKNNLVIYAEKKNIKRSVQSLKDELGLTSKRSSTRANRSQGNKLLDAYEDEETSRQGQHSLTQQLNHDLGNGMKLYQATLHLKNANESADVKEVPGITEKSHESVSVEGFNKGDGGTAGISMFGRGIGVSAPTFQTSPWNEKLTTPNGSTNLERTFRVHRRRMGFTTTITPPGRTMKKEGKYLAQFHGKLMTGDQNGAGPSNKEGENHESSCEVFRKAIMVQYSKCDNQDTGVSNPNDDSSKSMPTEKDESSKFPCVPNTENTQPNSDQPTENHTVSSRDPLILFLQTAVERSGQGTRPLSEMQGIHLKRETSCSMCMNFNNDPVYTSNCGRGHHYCKSCVKRSLEKSQSCPRCQKEGFRQGNQPTGCMTWITVTQNSLPGYEDCHVIIMHFKFEGGVQGREHPNPGKSYSPLYTAAFLPNNSEGEEVFNLLRRAFDARLLFTIGKSTTTGEENKIIWNDIELKTSQSGGPASYGYPDPTYIDRVKKQLAEKGITPSQE